MAFRYMIGPRCDFWTKLLTKATILSVVVVLRFPSLELVEKVYSYGPVDMPYMPGFPSFREAPNVIHAFAKLENKPDVIMVDGTLPYVFFSGYLTYP